MSDESVFQEVNEELRNEQMRDFWAKFGRYIIGAAVLIVVLVAANEGYKYWRTSQAANSGDQFLAALELINDDQIDAAQSALDDIAESGAGGYPILAKFKSASLLASLGKNDEASAAFDALATSADDNATRELALLYAAMAGIDEGDVAGATNRLQGLLADTATLRHSARETLGLTNYQAGELVEARRWFDLAGTDPAAPAEMRARLTVYTQVLLSLGVGPAEAEEVAPSTVSD